MVDFGIGLSYRPVSLCSLSGRYANPMPESTISPLSRNKNLATVQGKEGSAQGEGHEPVQEQWASSRERSGPMTGKAKTKEDKRPVQEKTVGKCKGRQGGQYNGGSTREGTGPVQVKAMGQCKGRQWASERVGNGPVQG
jgi:hypothetical protein